MSRALSGLFIGLLLVVAACVVYLIFAGTSIRSAPYIKPTEIESDFLNVPSHVFQRLFPDLSSARFVVFGLPMDETNAQKTLYWMKEHFERVAKVNVTTIDSLESATPEEIEHCHKPCWIILGQDEAHSLSPRQPNPLLEEKIARHDPKYISITWVPYVLPDDMPEKLSQECVEQKRLSMLCLKPVALRDVHKRFDKLEKRDSDFRQKRYFFLRKYMDHDYFLFIQN